MKCHYCRTREARYDHAHCGSDACYEAWRERLEDYYRDDVEDR